MKEATFFILVGSLAAVSLASGLIGWHISEHIEKKKHGKPSSFRDLYDDNDPVGVPVYPVYTDEPDYESDFTEDFLRFY